MTVRGSPHTSGSSSAVMLHVHPLRTAGNAQVVDDSTSLSRARPLTTITATAGLTILSSQSLEIMRNMNMVFVDPMRSAIESIAVLSFNFDVVHTECLRGSGAWRKFLIRH